MKMIKKFISFATMAAIVLSAGSCQKEISAGVDDGGAKVSFTLQTSSQTKAIADASNIDVLHWEIYGEDVENPASKPLAQGSEKDTDGDGVFTLDLALILDQTYNFIFWAQVDREEGEEHYDVSDLRKVRIMSYDDEFANDESRAAFFAHKTIHVSGSIEETITLYRPFSQLNLGAETYDVSSLNKTEPLKVNYSEVTAYGIADTFNTLTGEGEGSREVHFRQAATPNGDRDASEKLLEVNNTTYYWLGMNYLIVNGNSDNVKVDMKFYTTHGDVDLSIDNVPVKENFRTNIIGDLLTSEAIFQIVVDESFQTPDIIVGDEGGSEEGGETPVPDFEIVQDGDVITYTVYTPEGLEAWREAAHQDALNDTEIQVNLILGADIILDYIDGEANWIPVGTYDHPYDGTIDGAGHYISDMSIDSKDGPAGFIGAWDGEDGAIAAQNLIFRNVHIVSSNNYGTGTVIGYGHKKYIIKNCHVKGGSVSGIGGGPCGGLFGGGFEAGFGDGAGGSGQGFGGTAIGCTNSASVITSTITYYVGGIGGFGNAIDCTNTGTVTGSGYYIGGILGGSNGQVTGNKNQGKVTGGVYAGGIVGGIEDGKLENNSNNGDVFGTEEGKLGGIFGWLDESTDQSGNIYQCIVKVIVVDKDFTVKVEPEVTTYTVYTAEGLEIWRAAAHQNAVDKKKDKVNLLLAADIELPVVEDGSSNWTPLGTTSAPYNGVIDGAGYTISNLTIAGGSNIGFIGVASYKDNVVSNLKLANVNISGAKNVGAVIGQVTNNGKVDKCHVISGKVTASGDNVGGILGYSEYYGGAHNCTNEAEISGASYVGGIAGHAYATRSINRGDVTGTGSCVAGVYGTYSYGNTTENQNFGDITGVDKVAGITGNGTSSYSHNEGDITGRDYVAGISSGNSSSFLGNLGACTNKGTITGRAYVAGIISSSSNSLADCVNEGVIEGEQYVAGIASSLTSRNGNSNTVLARNENKGNVSGMAYVSGIVSTLSGKYNCNITENINSGDITAEDRVAAIVAYNENANVTYNTNSGNISGYTNIAHFVGSQNPSYSPDTVTGNVSTGTLNILENNDFTRTTDGTTVSYIVYTQKGFEAWVAEAHKSVEEGYACDLTLETDIVLPLPVSGESNWTPIGNVDKHYKGNIDAKNHTITNLIIKDVQSGMGFIGRISSGSIKNLRLANVTVIQNTTNNSNYVGAVVGYSAAPIENCHVLNGTIVGLDDWVGGIAGACAKTITGCTNKASVTGAEQGYYTNGYVGGITGEGNVVSCVNYGAVIGYQRYTGGCTGSGNATGCQNFGNVTKGDKDTYTGGITGNGDAENCTNSGTVAGYTNVGGVTGQGNATESQNSASVVGSADYVGGITASGGASGCTNSGDVTGKTYVGGISGSVSTDIVSNCTNSGNVTATGDYAGGIAGRHTNNKNASKATEFTNCENTGRVISTANYVGGIVGESNSGYCVIKESTNRGDVSGKDYVGGIAGSSMTVTDCDNYGDVAGNQSVGGISGAKYDAAHSISGSENNGDVTGVSYVGGIVGFADAGTVTDNTHSGKVSGQDKIGGIAGYNEEAAVTYNTHAGSVEGYTSVGAFVGGQDSSFIPDIVTGNVDNGTETILSPSDYTRELIGSEILYTVYSYDGLMAWHAEASEGCVSGTDKKYVVVNLDLQADITMPEGVVWTPIARNTSYPYKGKIVGNNKTISNLKINSDSNYSGFIGVLSGNVQNLKFNSVSLFSSAADSGAIVGYLYGGSVDNCHVISGTVESSGARVGGLVGQANYGTLIQNCSNAATVSGTKNVGGIVGNSTGHNSKGIALNLNNVNTGTVKGSESNVGGISGGASYTEIRECENFGSVLCCNSSGVPTSSCKAVGGIVGYMQQAISIVESNYNSGEILGYKNVGGIVGEIVLKATASKNTNEGVVKYKEAGSAGLIAGFIGTSSQGIVSDDNIAGGELEKIQ